MKPQIVGALLFVPLTAGAQESLPGWTSLTLVSAWGPCGPNQSCSRSWQIEQDVQVVRATTGENGNIVKDLAASDRRRLLALMESEAFTQGLRRGFACGPGPTDTFRSFHITFPDGRKIVRDIAGCHVDSVAGQVEELLQKY